MNKTNPSFSIGTLPLSNNIVYAPLAGCSDYPFRLMSSRYNPGLMFCEMVKIEALLRQNEGTYKMLEYHESMRPIGGQICGSSPLLAKQAAKIIEDLGFDVVDLNCGCPVDKVTKDGSGSGMLKNPTLIGETIANMVSVVKIPVTLKIRAGWDDAGLNAPEITEIAENAGASAIFVHGRTREQAYRGFANRQIIAECKKRAKKIKVFGNGDIFEAKNALEMLEETQVDGVLVARGTMGQPWIVKDILSLQNGIVPKNPTIQECLSALVDHFEISIQNKSEKAALIDMRKVCCWYLKNAKGAREFRSKASHAKTLDEVRDLIKEFPYE